MSSSLIRAFGLLSCLGLSACVATEPNSSSSSQVSSSTAIVSSSSENAASSSSIAANVSPSVSFATPSADYAFAAGMSLVSITANAGDADGNLASVTLRIDGNLIGTLNTPPFSWDASYLNALSVGPHALVLEATDSEGLSAQASQSITVRSAVNHKPSVVFTFPKDGEVLPNLSSVDVTVDATDPDGDALRVQMYIDGQLLAVDDQAPYRWPSNLLSQLQNMRAGTYILRAFVEDGRGESSVEEISFTVLEDNDFPTLTLLSPPENLVLPVGSSIDVLAEATDTDGTIKSVTVSFNGTDKEDLYSPYQWYAVGNPFLRDLTAGQYQLSVVALDDKGGKTSINRTVTISADAPAGAGDPSRGKSQYLGQCMRCHGQFGEGSSAAPALLPVKSQYSGMPLHLYIADRMPKDYIAGCEAQCGRNVATFIQEELASLRDQHNSFAGDAVAGEIVYAEQCVSCHGERGLGGSATALFPIRSGNNYTITNAEINTNGNLFAMVDLAMPRGTGADRLTLFGMCQGQCAADVVAYLQQTETTLTDAERYDLRVARGKQQYESGCGSSSCHGSDGRGRRAIVPLSTSERNNNSLDNNDGFFIYIRDRMPPSDATSCNAECAANVAIYIREVLD